MLLSRIPETKNNKYCIVQVARSGFGLIVALAITFGLFGCDDTNSSTVMQNENPAVASQIKNDIAENFGPAAGYKTSWYDNIVDVTVAGNTVFLKTNLSSKSDIASKVCGAASSFVFSNDNRHLGVNVVKVISQSGAVLINRNGIGERCS
jgi:uncharacterized protein YaaQ